MTPRSERVLLTGADGFTGVPLAKALRADGHDVVTLGRDEGVCDVAANLLNGEEIAHVIAQVRPTSIVHLAAIAFAPADDLHRLYTINVSGAAALLKAAARLSGVNSVILASSAKVYAPPHSSDPIAEDAPLGPIDHYGVSKLALEHVARLFNESLPITVVRPFNYTGPGQDPLFFIPKLVAAFVGNTPVTLGNLDLARDFSDVTTVVEVYRRLVNAPKPGATLNICSGIAVPLRRVLTLLEEITGRAIEASQDAGLVRTGEPEVIVGSPARLERAIGELPRPSLRQTLEGMVAALHRAS